MLELLGLDNIGMKDNVQCSSPGGIATGIAQSGKTAINKTDRNSPPKYSSFKSLGGVI